MESLKKYWKKINWKTWGTIIITPILTAVVTGCVIQWQLSKEHTYWEKQHNILKIEKIIEKKISLLEDIAYLVTLFESLVIPSAQSARNFESYVISHYSESPSINVGTNLEKSNLNLESFNNIAGIYSQLQSKLQMCTILYTNGAKKTSGDFLSYLESTHWYETYPNVNERNTTLKEYFIKLKISIGEELENELNVT